MPSPTPTSAVDASRTSSCPTSSRIAPRSPSFSAAASRVSPSSATVSITAGASTRFVTCTASDSPPARARNVSFACPARGAVIGQRTSTLCPFFTATTRFASRADDRALRGRRRPRPARPAIPFVAHDDARVDRVARAQEARQRRAQHQRPARRHLRLAVAEAVVLRHRHGHQAERRQVVRAA